ncbi:MAG: HNH endonuclease [Planctomycetota bacterium]
MAVKNQPEKYGAFWTREELILAFALYCRIPFKKTKASNPQVIELSRLLKRSPAGIARKLGNFGSFDPELKRQHITGLVHTSRLDGEVWDEFNGDWNRLVLEAERLRAELGSRTEQESEADTDFSIPQGASERETIRKTRIHQAFFREAILSSYEDTCCITGLRIKECLVASHIVPWSISEQHRTDPRNGLCLSATFDRLFDRGLIAVTSELDVFVSARLRKAGDRKVDEMICKYHGVPLVRPRRFLPLQAHLEWHRNNVFQD